MKKFTAFVLSLLTIVVFASIAWLLYSNFQTTPVVIINLVIMMTGVMLAFIVYNRVMVSSDKSSIQVNTDHFPYIERALIYVMPQDFVSKLEKNKGKIFMVSTDVVESDISLKDGDFNRLTDTITLRYTNGVSTKIRGSRTVAVGDNQFLFYGFDELIHIKGKTELIYQWEEDRLVQQVNGELVSINIPDRMPVYIFDWKE